MENRRHILSCFSILLLLCPLTWSGGHAQAVPSSGIDRRIDSLFAEWSKPGSPGCAVGIIRNGEWIYRRGFGMADIEHAIPITPHTVFNIGSTSKQFTAACILLLAQRGKLSLEDDVRKYIPELPDHGTKITIRQLLNHTSGLRDYITLLYLSGVHVEDRSTTRDALSMIERQKGLNFAPGAEWSYSNTGYFLASVIVERGSGMPLTAFAKENIFDPLGMNHTSWVADARAIIPDCAEGYAPAPEGAFQKSPSGWDQVGDGGLYTSLDDLLLWDRNFYTPRVGGAGLIEQLTTPGTLNDGTLLDYGLGMFLETYRGLRVVRHEGEWAGYKAELLRIPSQHFSVICLCNLNAIVPTQLARRIVDLCLPEKLTDRVISPPERRDTSILTTEQASSLVGYYRNPSDETVRRIVLRNGTLMYARVPGSESPLKPMDHDRFEMTGVPARVFVTFSDAHSSRATEMSVVVDSGKPLLFTPFEPATLTHEQLQEYAGTYYSDELNASYTIAVPDSQLVVHIKRFDSLPLRPTIRNIFKYEDFRVFTFRRDGEDRITGFTMTTGRARGLSFSRLARPPTSR